MSHATTSATDFDTVQFTSVEPQLAQFLDATQPPKLDPMRAIYTNRDLDLGEIKWIGFDMDYTLAIYRQQPMEQLQYDLTIERLIEKHKYPEEIRGLVYDPNFIIRGLIVDKRSGHLIKMDNHGQVHRAFYGRTQLDEATLESTYKNAKIRLASSNFASVDTLFSMPEACLYANIITYAESLLDDGKTFAPLMLPEGHNTPNVGRLNTWKLFEDVRMSIDEIHRDGSLKNIIMADLPTYIEQDQQLALALHRFRSSGKRLFLLTNSHWVYTNALMRYLLDGQLPEYSNWRVYFDIIVVGGSKPKFFTEKNDFIELDVSEPNEKLLGPIASPKFERGKIYQGGNLEFFEKAIQCMGEEILYVGDHIFGDILRSRKDSRWRTCLIVEELEKEIQQSLSHAPDLDTLHALDEQRNSIDQRIADQRVLLAKLELAVAQAKQQTNAPTAQNADGTSAANRTNIDLAHLEEAWRRLRREIDHAKRVLRTLDKRAQQLQDTLECRFNPSWGRLFKEHNELSRFGAQITAYACTYTSRVSNFANYSPMHFFRSPRDRMSHDFLLK